MERIEILVERLNRQLADRANPADLLATVKLLELELVRHSDRPSGLLGTAKIAVVLPAAGVTLPEMSREKPPAPLAEPAPVKMKKETLLIEEDSIALIQKNGQLDMVFDPVQEVPTLAHQPGGKEVNELAGEGESLNDRLKQGTTELMEVLKETPIRDLRKAIGINDRYVFINDLFRGDENMYERCIKTINNFNIYAEAEYWINRELKVKLGWANDQPAVQHFDQLVRRRFS